MTHRSKILTRYALAALAFSMALVLTPRALLDITEQADSHEIPVDMLEPTDGCLWCSEVQEEEDDAECDDTDEQERIWFYSEDYRADCRDVAPVKPSA